jgi:hypothetical protein
MIHFAKPKVVVMSKMEFVTVLMSTEVCKSRINSYYIMLTIGISDIEPLYYAYQREYHSATSVNLHAFHWRWICEGAFRHRHRGSFSSAHNVFTKNMFLLIFFC